MSTAIEITARLALVGGRLAKRGEVVDDAPDDIAERLIATGGAKAVATEEAGSDALPVVIEVDGQEVDLSTIDDAAELREIAGKIGLEIPGNVKKTDTLIERIVAHKAAEEAGSDG
jgi:hypothetical protein